MSQVEEAFNGRYREVNRETQQWYTYNHPIPEPRPGAVFTFLSQTPCLGCGFYTFYTVLYVLYSKSEHTVRAQ